MLQLCKTKKGNLIHCPQSLSSVACGARSDVFSHCSKHFHLCLDTSHPSKNANYISSFLSQLPWKEFFKCSGGIIMNLLKVCILYIY